MTQQAVFPGMEAPAPTQVFVVIGSTGEYSDHNEWPVRAYFKEQSAKDEVERLTRLSNSLTDEDKECEYLFDERNEKWTLGYKLMKEADPDYKCDYTGTHYHYWTMPLGEE